MVKRDSIKSDQMDLSEWKEYAK